MSLPVTQQQNCPSDANQLALVARKKSVLSSVQQDRLQGVPSLCWWWPRKTIALLGVSVVTSACTTMSDGSELSLAERYRQAPSHSSAHVPQLPLEGCREETFFQLHWVPITVRDIKPENTATMSALSR